ncbi:MAG: hypothetical protein ACO3JL_01535 [Myxococcota bacterium]
MQLTPRSVGELLTEGIALLRRWWRTFAIAALPFCVLELLCRDALLMVLGTIVRSLDPELPLEAAGAVLANKLAQAAACGAALALTSWMLAVVGTFATEGALRDEVIEPRELIARGFRRAPQLLLTALLWGGIVTLVVLVPPPLLLVGALAISPTPLTGIIAGLVGLLWFVIALVMMGLRFALWPQILALEERFGRAALARSVALMGPRGVSFTTSPKLRLSLLLLVYFALQSAVQQLFLLPTLLQGFQHTPPFSGDLSLWALPLYLAAPLAALQVASNSLLLPLAAVFSTLFYRDLRIRFEGVGIDDHGSQSSLVNMGTP